MTYLYSTFFFAFIQQNCVCYQSNIERNNTSVKLNNTTHAPRNKVLLSIYIEDREHINIIHR